MCHHHPALARNLELHPELPRVLHNRHPTATVTATVIADGIEIVTATATATEVEGVDLEIGIVTVTVIVVDGMVVMSEIVGKVDGLTDPVRATEIVDIDETAIDVAAGRNENCQECGTKLLTNLTLQHCGFWRFTCRKPMALA